MEKVRRHPPSIVLILLVTSDLVVDDLSRLVAKSNKVQSYARQRCWKASCIRVIQNRTNRQDITVQLKITHCTSKLKKFYKRRGLPNLHTDHT